jgi:integrase
MKEVKYPTGTKISAWFLETPKKEKPRIRREIRTPENQRKTENYPLKKFSHLLGDISELKDFVIRLNGKDPRIVRIQNRLEFEHAFIRPDFLDEYQNIYLRRYIPSEAQAKKLVFYLRTYFLNYFVGRLNLANPIEWKREEASWGVALINKQAKNQPCVFDDGKNRSAKVIKTIIYEANRFMRYVHSKRPDIAPIVFEPLSKAILKDHEATRVLNDEVREIKYIPEDHWKLLEKNLKQKDWGALPLLCYNYGLRRKEAYGTKTSDLKKGFLSVERQLEKITEFKQRTFKPLKSRYQRKTPHWFGNISESYELIQRIERLTLHPDTFNHLFIDLCRDLKLPAYTLHDLRRTFITNSIKKGVLPEDLRLAVGHADSSTTYKYYAMDAREMESECWIPTTVG